VILKVTPQANKDALRIQRELEGFSTGMGVRFREELERCWRYVLQYPGGFQFRFRNYRYTPLAIFQYHVIYSLRGEIIIVHRIRHMRQQPLKRYFGR
jgi:plasmid stabilization system protein ParE